MCMCARQTHITNRQYTHTGRQSDRDRDGAGKAELDKPNAAR